MHEENTVKNAKTDRNTFFWPFFFFKGHTHGIWRFPARGQISATAAVLHHTGVATAKQDPSHVCDLYNS